jgi:hypothetical protein
MMYFETSSKLKSARADENERFGEYLRRESGRRGEGETTAIDILDARELASVVGVETAGEYEPEPEPVGAEAAPVMMRPSGTW